MKRFLHRFHLIAILIISLPIFISSLFSKDSIIPTDSSQSDFLNAYKLVLYESYIDYRFTSTTIDTILFPKWGEETIYWVKTGANKGSFVYPDKVPTTYSSVSYSEQEQYNWQEQNHYAIQYKPNSKLIGIFKSNLVKDNSTVSWEARYFKNLFDSYLFDYIHYYTNELEIDTAGINGSTQIIIIPAFSLQNGDNKYFIDSIFRYCRNLKAKFDAFLARGGTIYAEGNAVYFIEKLGYLTEGAVDFSNFIDPDPENNLLNLNFVSLSNPISFTQNATGNYLYSNAIPTVALNNAEIIATTDGEAPAVFVLKANQANGGKIICNLGIPTVGGTNALQSGSRQLQWTLNALMYAFSKNIDVVRSIYNDIADSIPAGKNAIAYDIVDTFEVRIKIRNLSNEAIDNLEINEYIRNANIGGTSRTYFDYVDVITPGVSSTYSGNRLKFFNISMPANSEKEIIYRLKTPLPGSIVHENVDLFLSWASYIYCSYNVTVYNDEQGYNSYNKYRNYADIMFSARIVADADLNWKNFLGLYYQPFKVFMIMENKQRTSAEKTVYTQYIPKDVPFYWSDKSINIPILKTPGGKYVDVLRGSNDQNNPEYDMDNDGKPDAWLDTASIYPKGYKIEETEVYWLNPWEHLRSGNHFYYEDIDHDGLQAQDIDGDGIVDIEEPGDKIRVWKVTWEIGKISGYEYFDPYCSYEIWVDPPDLVPMSAGVGFAYHRCNAVPGMFYPYSEDINNPNLADTSWKHWMERDANGNIIWKQLIYQKIHNYEGFTFIDTLNERYRLLGTDFCVGTVPQPHREFIAVLSLGGEEIDMTHPTPQQSLYSKVEYKTIFKESRTTPIRTTYTYYAPLPNPLQFEYLSNTFTITDTSGRDTLKYLPEWGKVNLIFDALASTEYSYYWIRNAGHDVDYNDPSLAIEGNEKLGDGVFGYMIYDIPKGLGGYKITLPKKPDGSYDIDKIVSIDGDIFKKWLDNPNTKNEIEIWEDPFEYHVYIPQLLIPPALDDDNFDRIDDWIDDRGDRFCSRTGFLHDAFMLDNGEQWLNYPEQPFKDDIYGMVDSGWYHGPDNTYGDDFFEALGKTHIQIHAIYEGKGREGPIDISKGGWLVVEEIFGGSPWVIFSHTLSAYAKGVDYTLTSRANPTIVRFGRDTIYIKHTIQDTKEPHNFDVNFDPYHVSYGYGEATITTLAGGKDPCSLIEPPITSSTIIDPKYDHRQVRLIPYADTTNPDLAGYPRNTEGTFLIVRVEVMNGTEQNWINTKLTPIIPPELGNTKIEMGYVAYPRPLVPAKVDPVTGEIIQGGDDIGAFRAGWRFNQPEGEVLIKMGNTLPLLQPSRRAYFVYLVKIDETLPKGVYSIGFFISGEKRYYYERASNKKERDDKTLINQINYDVPPVYFSISTKKPDGNVAEYQKIVIGTGSLNNIKVKTTDYYKGLENAKWSLKDVNNTDFSTMTNKLNVKYDPISKTETIDLSQFNEFPTTTNTKFYILQQGEVNSYEAGENVDITTGEELNFTVQPFGKYLTTDKKITVITSGPKIIAYKNIKSINGVPVKNNQLLGWGENGVYEVEAIIGIQNLGNDIADKTELLIQIGQNYLPIEKFLPNYCSLQNSLIKANLSACVPGEKKEFSIKFNVSDKACSEIYSISDIIRDIKINYYGRMNLKNPEKSLFSYSDNNVLNLPAADLRIKSLLINKNLISIGELAFITAEVENGQFGTKNITLEIFAILNNSDTVLVAKEQIDKFAPKSSQTFNFNFFVPDTVGFIKFFANLSTESIEEFCMTNNSKELVVPIKGPAWILNVNNIPNPFKNITELNYTLPRPVDDLTISIFNLDGVEVQRITNCPATVGSHSLSWNASNIPNATYMVKFTAKNLIGDIETYYMKCIKE